MKRGATALRLLRESMRKRGLRGTVARMGRIVAQQREARRKASADFEFDRAHGVDTAAWVRVPDLDTSSANLEHAVRYQPSSVEEFELLMGKLDVDLRKYTFVDYGSGKGRVLMLAAEYPFKRIVGVEFAESLIAISDQNVATLGADAERIESVHVDATEYEPPSGPVVLYFFHPFGVPALRGVLARVHESLEREPRPVYLVVTAPPEFAQAIEESGFAKVDVDELGWLTRGVFVGSTDGKPSY